MRALKAIYLLWGLWFVASAILGIQEIYSAHSHTPAMNHATFRTIWSIFAAAFCGAAAYGIHKKALVAWKIGFGVIAAALLEFLASALPATSTIPENDHPGVAAAAVVVTGAAVALYWGFWWKKQKSYFVKSAAPKDPHK